MAVASKPGPMGREPGGTTRLVAWNGLRLNIPTSWEARVVGLRQLLFEEDFQPRLQLRWEPAGAVNPKKVHRRLRSFLPPGNLPIAEGQLAAPWRQLARTVAHLSCFAATSGEIDCGFLLCRHCATTLLFHCPEGAPGPQGATELAEILATSSCHSHGDTLWQLQDFTLATPHSFTLRNYTFAAGLTRLSLAGPAVQLESCRLSAAGHRLAQQSLPAILSTLAGTGELATSLSAGGECCDGRREPLLLEQLRLRLRREHPFIRARIRHDQSADRLLALVLSGKGPIAAALLDQLDASHAILPSTSKAPPADQK